MHPRILTKTERKRIQAYLREDGKKITPIRQLVTRSKQFLPAIEQDLALIRKLLDHYG
jgi:hypothetical protein